MIKKNSIVFLMLTMGLLPLSGAAALTVLQSDKMEESSLCNHALMDESIENHSNQSEVDCVFIAHCSFHSCGSFGMAVSVFLPEFTSSRRFFPLANTATRNLLPPPEIRPPIFTF